MAKILILYLDLNNSQDKKFIIMAPIEFPRMITINFRGLNKLKFNTKNGKSAMQCLKPHNINIMIEKTVIILFLFETAMCIHIPHNEPKINNANNPQENLLHAVVIDGQNISVLACKKII